ncbi:MAG: cysteine--tRNA ligase [Pseudorhodobacter sp.]
MTRIRLHNSLTRRKEEFIPLDADNVRIYVCGPTVYDRAHLGNARPVVVFDTLFRLMRHVYGADHVTYVRNFTDVDDKINAEAQRRKAAGRPESLEDLIRERTGETIAWYHADMDAIGALRPTKEPRATEWIGAMIAMIEGLIAGGHAYEKQGHVLFRVRSYRDYGTLSGRSVDDMIAGARVEVAPFKEDPMDFVLWKPSDIDLPGWDSPWGRGRPGWHIECSAMSHELLGESFDIHGGGLDLQFPHHENELAQSRCAHPHGGFAKVWMHNEMLQVEGGKMSKSLGNFFTVHDLLEQGIPGEVIRFVMLSTHYRKPMDWTEKRRLEARHKLTRYFRFVRDFAKEELADPNRVSPEIIKAFSDDLNTHAALTHLDQLANRAENELRGGPSGQQLAHDLRFLGFWPVPDWAIDNSATRYAGMIDLSGLRDKLTALRAEAMQTKDFTGLDAMKAALIDAGLEVRMSRQGIELIPMPGFDPEKLEVLI